MGYWTNLKIVQQMLYLLQQYGSTKDATSMDNGMIDYSVGRDANTSARTYNDKRLNGMGSAGSLFTMLMVARWNIEPFGAEQVLGKHNSHNRNREFNGINY